MGKIARMLAPVVAVAAVAGCATPTGGTAFDVSGRTVSTRQVNKAVADCTKLTQSTSATASQLRTAVADWYLQGLIGEQVAADHNVQITDAQKSALIKANNLSQFQTGGACQDAIDKALTATIAVNKMGKSAFLAAAKKLPVKVNPEYGSYDPSTLGVSGTSGSLSFDGVAPTTISGS